MLNAEKQQQLPWWEKYSLTIAEAAAYYNLDEEFFKELSQKNPKPGFITKNGNHILINKKLFEGWFYKEQEALCWWEKYSLSIDEAAAYYNIGENKLRVLINNNPDLDFIVRVGQRTTINKKKFEQWYDRISDI